MKKFITYIPLQTGKNMQPSIYDAPENPRLATGTPIRFPITAIVTGYAGVGEHIGLITIIEEENEDSAQNLALMKEEIGKLAEAQGFSVEFTPVYVSKKETVEEQLKTFSRLIDLIEDDDIIHACITFGTKPIPIIEFMALHFAYKVKRNVSIECLAYGKVNWVHNEAKGFSIYDVTALFSMNELVGELADARVDDPAGMIARILRIE